jgi:hypothetical protein
MLRGGCLSKASIPLLIGTLSIVSPVGYFAGYLIPDIFTALAILGAAHLFVLRNSISKGEAVYWFAIVCGAELFHNSNTAIVLAMTLAYTGALFVLKRVFDWRAALTGFAALLIALGGNAAFSYAVERATGEGPVGPPFVAARLIADGPGYDYLKATCPSNGFYLCNFMDVSRDSNTFLWAERRPEGAFKALNPWQQRLVAKEQSGFVLAVIRDRPMSVIASSATNFVRELTNFRLPYFNYRAGLRSYFGRKLPESLFERTQATYAFQNKMPEQSIEIATRTSAVLSLAVLLFVLFRARSSPTADQRLQALTAMVLLGVLANAFVCGALSSPAPRYNMRAIWLLPLLALSMPRIWSHFLPRTSSPDKLLRAAASRT